MVLSSFSHPGVKAQMQHWERLTKGEMVRGKKPHRNEAGQARSPKLVCLLQYSVKEDPCKSPLEEMSPLKPPACGSFTSTLLQYDLGLQQCTHTCTLSHM